MSTYTEEDAKRFASWLFHELFHDSGDGAAECEVSDELMRVYKKGRKDAFNEMRKSKKGKLK